MVRGGFHAYSGFPYAPLRVFFFCLVLIGPLVVVLGALVLVTAPGMLRVARRATPAARGD